VLATVGAVVLSGVGGGVALAVGRGGEDRYRTATVERADVEQSVDAVGTLASATRRDAAFSVAGTVATVDVTVGQQVAAGDVLATLDLASLQEAVDDAEAELADAQDQLDADLASQTSSTSSSSSTPSPSASTGTTGTTGQTGSTGQTGQTGQTGSTGSTGQTGSTGTRPDTGTGTDPAIEAAVAAVRSAQQDLLTQHEAARQALAASGTSVEASRSTCAAFLDLVGDDVDGDPGPTPTASTSPTPASSDAATTGTDTGTTTDAAPTTDAALTPTDDSAVQAAASASDDVVAALTACQDAITGTLTAQQATDAAQQALTSLVTALDEAVATLHAAVTAATGDDTDGAGSPTGSDDPTGTDDATGTDGTTTPSTSPSAAPSGTSTSSPSTTSTTPDTSAPTRTSSPSSDGASTDGTTGAVASAATVLADQAAVDAAQARVTLAEAALPFATLTSPVAGTVAAVALAPGDAVTASSSTAVVTVIGTDGFTVSTTVPLGDVDVVAVGQAAQVTTPSTDAVLTGTVSSVGLLDVSTTSEPSYTLVVALDATDERLFDGASAQVEVTVAGAVDVLTVPTSAVRVSSDDGTTVQVLDGATPSTVTVEVGAVGAERTEVLSGVSVGDEVVLADLQQAVETGETSSSAGLSGLGGSDEQRGPSMQGGPGGGFVGGPPTNVTRGQG